MSNADAVPFATTSKVRDTCLCLHLQRAARAVGRRFDAALRPLGLTNGQFSLLMSLIARSRRAWANLGLARNGSHDPDRQSEAAGAARAGGGDDRPDGQAKPPIEVDAGRRRSAEGGCSSLGETHTATECLARTDPDELRHDLRALSAEKAGAASGNMRPSRRRFTPPQDAVSVNVTKFSSS